MSVNVTRTSTVPLSPLNNAYSVQNTDSNRDTPMSPDLFVSSPVYSNNDLLSGRSVIFGGIQEMDNFREDRFMSVNVQMAPPTTFNYRRNKMTKSTSDSHLCNSGSHVSTDSTTSTEFFTIVSYLLLFYSYSLAVVTFTF